MPEHPCWGRGGGGPWGSLAPQAESSQFRRERTLKPGAHPPPGSPGPHLHPHPSGLPHSRLQLPLLPGVARPGGSGAPA